MKNVDTRYLKVPEYRRTDATASQHEIVDIREHAVACPIFDLVTPKDDDSDSIN